MKVIYKYPIEPITRLNIPVDARVLTVKTQKGKPYIWVSIDDDELSEEYNVERTFVAVATGEFFGDKGNHQEYQYIDTFLVENDSLVFHVFEKMR